MQTHSDTQFSTFFLLYMCVCACFIVCSGFIQLVVIATSSHSSVCTKIKNFIAKTKKYENLHSSLFVVSFSLSFYFISFLHVRRIK